MKLEVKLALQKYRCKFNGTQWQRFYSWWKDMAHYASKENCSLSDFLPTTRLSAQIYMFGGFYGALWQSGVTACFSCQVQFRDMVLLQSFSKCNAAWGWIPFHFYLIILSRGYTASRPAYLRNQSCLAVSLKNQIICIFSWYPKKFASIKLGKSPGCCITKTPRTQIP